MESNKITNLLKMNDSDLFNYIETKLNPTSFPGIKLITRNISGKGFSILKYEFKKVQISFVIDRGYLEGEIFKNGTYTSFSKLNPSFKSLSKTVENIDFIVNFLYDHKDEIFKE